MAKLIITYPYISDPWREDDSDVPNWHCFIAALCISFTTYKSIPKAIAVLSGVVFNSVSKSKPRSTSESFDPSAISID